MVRLTLLFSFLSLFTVSSAGQDDPAAIKILDKFSANALGAPSVSMKFMLIKLDQMESTSDTLTGSIIMSKDRYKLDLPDNIIWFNGETSWSYLPAEKEVTITLPDKDDNSFQNRPSSIFSLYKNGYKSRLVEEMSSSYIIDLYPEDIKSDLLRIRLSIGKSQTDLKNLEYKGRDGTVITLIVQDYSLRQKPEAGTFVFQPGKFKGVDIIDMR
jgi:outer membrane lipoprotein carrier protein